MKIKITEKHPMPESTVTQKLAWLGTTGSGKTYGASKMAEEFWKLGAQFVVLDPVGVWYGLRLGKDGKKPSDITIPIFGGLHGDVPLEPTGGEMLANLIVDKNLSCVIDVSQFESDSEKARFAKDFANKFFFRKKASPSAVHLFLEECQEFVPQNPQRGEEQMLHAFVRMQKLGRNFGIGSSYITQRPQEVNKKALNMAQTLFVFRTTGTHERNAIEKWIEDKSLDESIAQDLPKIETGNCHIWSPEFLKISDTARILPKETFNASATPEVGATAKVRELAPIDLEKVREDMAATIEKAKNDDPKLLRKRITDLETQIKTVPKTLAKPEDLERAVKIATLQKEKEYDKERSEMIKHTMNLMRIIQEIGKIASPFLKEKIEITTDLKPIFKPTNTPIAKSQSPQKYPVLEEVRPNDLTGPEQKILNALAWFESIGLERPAQELIAFLSGYAHIRSTGYTNPRGYLKTKGMVDYSSGSVFLTDLGRTHAETPSAPLTQDELQRIVLERLDGPERRILTPLLAAYPNGISNTDLCLTAGYAHERSTGYTNPRGKLRTFGLIEYEVGEVKAKSLLFLE